MTAVDRMSFVTFMGWLLENTGMGRVVLDSSRVGHDCRCHQDNGRYHETSRQTGHGQVFLSQPTVSASRTKRHHSVASIHRRGLFVVALVGLPSLLVRISITLFVDSLQTYARPVIHAAVLVGPATFQGGEIRFVSEAGERFGGKTPYEDVRVFQLLAQQRAPVSLPMSGH
jgi:hypothetical protein